MSNNPAKRPRKGSAAIAAPPPQVACLIVDKNATIKPAQLVAEEFATQLYRKCGFKSADDFAPQYEWKRVTAPAIQPTTTTSNPLPEAGKKIVYNVVVFGKRVGKATTENKYDFPPPLDTTLLFGSCAIALKRVVYDRTSKRQESATWIDMTAAHWAKIYDKLFGGFDRIRATIEIDEAEEDVLATVPKEFKTKTGGYLKDGFVVSSGDDDDDDEAGSDAVDGDADAADDESVSSTTSTTSSSTFESLSSSSSGDDSGDDSETVVSIVSDIIDDDVDVDVDADADAMDLDEDNDIPIVRKPAAKKRGKASTTTAASRRKAATASATPGPLTRAALSRKKKAAEADAFDLGLLEKDELSSELYVSSDDEDEAD